MPPIPIDPKLTNHPIPLVQETGWIDNDIEMASGPKKRINDLAWSSADNLLAVASCDRHLRIYEVKGYPDGEQKLKVPFDDAVLSCDWSRDGTMVVGAGADKSARVLDVTGEARAVCRLDGHADDIRTVKFFDHRASRTDLVVTGSWDHTVKYWDLRQKTSIGGLDFNDRVDTLDVDERMLVIGTADRDIHVVDLLQPCKFHLPMASPLTSQTRVVKCLPGVYGFAVGSADGRCAIHYLDSEAEKNKRNYELKCYRQDVEELTPIGRMDRYALNAISCHPRYRTVFSTACSDGTFMLWDYKTKKRVRSFPTVKGAILATAFNKDGSLFAYAVSQERSGGKGQQGRSEETHKVMLHEMSDDEIHPYWRKPAEKRG
ncbi:hypothetical protein VTN77DRAFT_9326 [Rasamsonia byssochlamydoides]|uniref:uncharacterized protein n=1 Tax=Rasamsonia byssochlamydoides TaxID=89139 RepID=UPI003742D0EC